MFCSTIIPTIGRSTLSRAVYSVLDQTFTAADFEVIVVNDSGKPLPEANWQTSDRVQVINTNRRERSVARNTGAAIAKGKYLHFLDDDDWLLPGALKIFWTLTRTNGEAVWLYGGSQLVDRQGKPLIQLHHSMNGNCFIQVMAGEWIPLQASVIEAETFFAVGGFNPLLLATEDIGLGRQIALRGNLANTPAIVACIGMGEDDSSSHHARKSEYSRWARENLLNEPNVFGRMGASASSAEWYGRIVRIYLTSVVWNLHHKRLFTAASRAAFGLVSFVFAGRHIFLANFWRAIMTRYTSNTFLAGFQEAGLSPF